MSTTRWVTAFSFVIGSAGVAFAALTDSVPIAILSAALFMASLIILARHFWRERERSRHSTEAKIVAELGRQTQALNANRETILQAISTENRQLTDRVDAFSRAILEYMAQLELDLGELSGRHNKLAERWKAQSTSLEVVGKQVVSQIGGVIAVYNTLRPSLPYPDFGGYAIGGDCARRLVSLILRTKARRVIEVGSGLSTLLAAQALELIGSDGRVVSLEHEKAWMDRTMDLLEQHGMGHRVDLVNAPLVDIELNGETFRWYDLQEADLPAEAEVIFIDGPPESTGPAARYPGLPLLIDHLAPSGVVLLDDAAREGEAAVIERWRNEYPDIEVVIHPDARGSAEIRRVAK